MMAHILQRCYECGDIFEGNRPLGEDVAICALCRRINREMRLNRLESGEITLYDVLEGRA
jgi:hypothetical protein